MNWLFQAWMYNSKLLGLLGKMLGFDFKKRHIKGEKHIAQMDFAKYLR